MAIQTFITRIYTVCDFSSEKLTRASEIYIKLLRATVPRASEEKSQFRTLHKGRYSDKQTTRLPFTTLK